MCAEFQEKLVHSRLVGARKKVTWFIKNNRALSKFWYGFLHYLISIIKIYENQSIKPSFILTT